MGADVGYTEGCATGYKPIHGHHLVGTVCVQHRHDQDESWTVPRDDGRLGETQGTRPGARTCGVAAADVPHDRAGPAPPLGNYVAMSADRPSAPTEVSKETTWFDRAADRTSHVVAKPPFFLA